MSDPQEQSPEHVPGVESLLVVDLPEPDEAPDNTVDKNDTYVEGNGVE